MVCSSKNPGNSSRSKSIVIVVLGRQVFTVEVIDSAHSGVTHQQLIGKLSDRFAHGKHYPALARHWQATAMGPKVFACIDLGFGQKHRQ
jgi:hypothetical protein